MTGNKTTVTVKCPQCKSSVIWSTESTFRPFCSERCKLIDLGEWAMEEKRIPGESLAIDTEIDDNDFFQ